MNPPIKCELHFFQSPFLSNVYEGFEMLRKAGVVEISVKNVKSDGIPLLTVILNDKVKVIYDALDGLNWIEESPERNLAYFKDNIVADFYFKRACSKEVKENAPGNCKVFPMGLIYPIRPSRWFSASATEMFMEQIRNNRLYARYRNSRSFSFDTFEHYPIPASETKILFLTRLWDPADGHFKESVAQRHKINNDRIECIRACKKEFGKYFLGGVQADNYSRKVAPELIVPPFVSDKRKFIETVKEHNICIATTGLHNSIGWKFAEYIAASRAIVSEPLHNELPGDFRDGHNYLTYTSEKSLLEQISTLMQDRQKLTEMMVSNHRYYLNYVRPDSLVLNTLLTANRGI